MQRKISQEQLLNLEKRYGIIPAKRDSMIQIKHHYIKQQDNKNDESKNEIPKTFSADIDHSTPKIQFIGEEVISIETEKVTIGKKSPNFTRLKRNPSRKLSSFFSQGAIMQFHIMIPVLHLSLQIQVHENDTIQECLRIIFNTVGIDKIENPKVYSLYWVKGGIWLQHTRTISAYRFYENESFRLLIKPMAEKEFYTRVKHIDKADIETVKFYEETTVRGLIHLFPDVPACVDHLGLFYPSIGIWFEEDEILSPYELSSTEEYLELRIMPTALFARASITLFNVDKKIKNEFEASLGKFNIY